MVNKADHLTKEQQKSLQDKITALNGTDPNMTNFLKEYSHVLGGDHAHFNEGRELDANTKASEAAKANGQAAPASPAAAPAPVTALNVTVNNKPIEMHSLTPAAGAPVTQLTKESMDKLSTEVSAATSGLAAGSESMKAEFSKIQAALKEGLTKVGITSSDQQNAILNQIKPGLGLPPTVANRPLPKS
jgi:hypothetical protein